MGKYLAPIIIAVLSLIVLSGYALFYSYVVDKFAMPDTIKIVVAIIFGMFGIAMIVVLVHRIRELSKEDNDDYSKY